MISIIIPCYNRKEMLRECIDSFIAQTYTDWELVVADDASTEDLTFIKDIDPRIKYFRQDKNCYVKAFNLALDSAIGEYIMPFGSDDIASHKKLLKRTYQALQDNTDYDAVYTDHWTQHADGNKFRTKFDDAHQSYTNEECYKRMLKRQFIPHGGVLWKKDKKPRYDETLESGLDLELYLTALERGVRFYHIPERLWTYKTGHAREGTSKRQIDSCNKTLGRRGYYFDKKTRGGVKL